MISMLIRFGARRSTAYWVLACPRDASVSVLHVHSCKFRVSGRFLYIYIYVYIPG